MTDFNFDPNTMTRAYAQRKALTEEENVRPKAIPKGIASKPDDGNTDTSSDEPDFYDKMLDELLGYFSSEDDADKVFSDKTPDRQDTQTSYEAMFGGLSQETRDAVEQTKQKRRGPADRRDVDVVEKEVITEETKPITPKIDLSDLQIMKPEGIEDMPPLPKPATDDGGLMSRDTSPEEAIQSAVEEAMATPDAGLMSKPLTDDDMGLPDAAVGDDKYAITRLGDDWDNKNQDDVKVLQSLLGNMGGAIPPKTGAVDGLWGAKGRNALWTFQVRAGLKPTGEMNTETSKALNAPDTLDPRKAAGSAPVIRKDIKQLVAAEDFRVMPYELNSNKSERSGLTIGAGIDVGQRTAQELKDDFGFTDAMIEEFGVYDASTNPSGWIGRNPAAPNEGGQGGAPGTAARNNAHAEMAAEYERQRVAGELPVVKESWLVDNMADVYDEYVPAVKEAYEEAYGDGSWDALPAEVQAMPVLETYRGDPINNDMLLAMSEGRYFDAANLAVKSSRKNSYKKVLRAEGHNP